jgi:hypothetical protein
MSQLRTLPLAYDESGAFVARRFVRQFGAEHDLGSTDRIRLPDRGSRLILRIHHRRSIQPHNGYPKDERTQLPSSPAASAHHEIYHQVCPRVWPTSQPSFLPSGS